MPIYEFYCRDCHTVFTFLSRKPGSRRRPSCPKCERPQLDKQVSSFAISKGRPEPAGENGMPEPDEAKMERAMESLAREAEGISEDDPRAMARLMRKFYESTGMAVGDGVEEAMRRMEAGEDPEQIEQDLGDLLEDEAGLFENKRATLKRLRRRMRPPEVDDTLYEL